MANARILLVEDDANLGNLLEEYLTNLGFKVQLAVNGEEGYSYFRKGEFDLCILDVMLPKKDGFTLASDIRKLDEQIPLVFLTARGQNEDRIKGFKTGCDDYITKPFISEELALRVEAILKRCSYSGSKKNSNLQIGSYIFDTSNYLLIYGDSVQKLTVKEAHLLNLLCQSTNTLLPRHKAQMEVWGSSDYFIGRSMDVFIARLRKYLSNDPKVCIQNVHGAGFRLEIKEEVERTETK